MHSKREKNEKIIVRISELELAMERLSPGSMVPLGNGNNGCQMTWESLGEYYDIHLELERLNDELHATGK